MSPPPSSIYRTPAPFALGIFLALALPCASADPDDPLPLPAWEDNAPADDSFLSLSLFPEPAPQSGNALTDTGSLAVPPPLRDPNSPFEPLLEPLELHPLVVLDGGIEPELDTAPKAPGEIEILLEDLQVYRSQPQNYLVNPQHLLSEPLEFDLSEFLEYHASESGIPIYILLADGDQRMPDRFHLADTVDTWFPDTPACVILYFLGYPSRSEIVLSPPLRNIAETISGEEIVEHSAEDALVASDPIDQLSRFSVRTSIRMFWLEKHFRESRPDTLTATKEQSSFAAAAASALGALFSSPKFYASILALFALTSGFFLARSWKIARTGGRIYIFPDFDLNQRLGAPHSGGSHIVIDFHRNE